VSTTLGALCLKTETELASETPNFFKELED
jgi:hypothetical protein